MDAADAARCEDFQTCALCNPGGRRNSRRTVPTFTDRNRQVAPTYLVYVAALGDVFELFSVKADVDDAFEDGNGCRDCAL